MQLVLVVVFLEDLEGACDAGVVVDGLPEVDLVRAAPLVCMTPRSKATKAAQCVLANHTTPPPSGARFGLNAYNVTSYKPHAWAMRRAQTGRRRFRIGASPWEGMGGGFTDQGFAEHFFALQHKNLYSVSHRTCKLKYVHFNMPPKQSSVSCISSF